MVNFLKSFKTNSAIDRINEERLYEFVVNEIKNGVRREGLWGKALQQANGELKLTEANYIKLRVQSLIDEKQIIESENETVKNSNLNKFNKNSVNKKIIKKPKNKDEVSGKKFLTFLFLFLLTLIALFVFPLILI